MSPRPSRTQAISTSIVALVIIGAGAYVGYLSQQEQEQPEERHQQPPADRQQRLAFQRRQGRGDRRRRPLRVRGHRGGHGDLRLLRARPRQHRRGRRAPTITLAPLFGPEGTGLAFSGGGSDARSGESCLAVGACGAGALLGRVRLARLRQRSRTETPVLAMIAAVRFFVAERLRRRPPAASRRPPDGSAAAAWFLASATEIDRSGAGAARRHGQPSGADVDRLGAGRSGRRTR